MNADGRMDEVPSARWTSTEYVPRGTFARSNVALTWVKESTETPLAL